jgi:hypothetical protein
MKTKIPRCSTTPARRAALRTLVAFCGLRGACLARHGNRQLRGGSALGGLLTLAVGALELASVDDLDERQLALWMEQAASIPFFGAKKR